MMDIVDTCRYFIAVLYNMCVQVFEFIAGGKAGGAYLSFLGTLCEDGTAAGCSVVDFFSFS